ncbi:MAG: tetratricopeptide repeat protein, partial [Alphaproteobacteria bacterium]|nr:tetratricopeptide repeat protein [Alphaproteobacteria bacterium]
LQNGSLIVISSDVGERFDAALASAAAAADKGFIVNVINVSPKTGEKLKMAAEKGGGVYLNYNQNLAELVKKINDVTDKEIKQSQNMQTVWEDGGWYLLWLPALLILLYFRRGALLALLFCLFYMGTAQANWFLNDNQNALRNFKQQNYAEAAEQFKNVQWKASAAYKNGDYTAAYENFAKGNDATALYNQGNALAKSGKIAEAIKKYEEVLQKQPDFEDAEFNLEYLKKQQQQQNQQQQSQNSSKQKQQQSQGSNKQQEQNKQSEQNEQQSPQKQQNKKQDSESGQQQNSTEQQQNPQQQEMQQNSQSGGSGEQEQQQGRPAQDEAQKQAAENQQNQADRQNSAQQSQNQSGEADKPADNSDEAEAQLKPAEQQGGEEQQGLSVGTNDEKSAEEQEKIRARMQKFRRIPEDKGGLLRAMIYKEYAKRRYND